METQTIETDKEQSSPELPNRMNAYWRAANYPSVGQMYLHENPLLRKPLKPENIKNMLLGHCGTTPGQSFIYVHLNRIINQYDLDILFLSGPGFGGQLLSAMLTCRKAFLFTNNNLTKMKNVIISSVVLALFFASCSSDSNKAAESSAVKTESETNVATTDVKKNPISDLLTEYLQLKNALTKDNTNDAAAAGKELVTAIGKVDVNDMTAEQKQTFDDISPDATEQAEHIGDNSGKIEHQREHFAMLSTDVNDLITAFGTDQKLYQDYCPIYGDGKGAIWISETKEIKNPYFGNIMLNCGKLKTEL